MSDGPPGATGRASSAALWAASILLSAAGHLAVLRAAAQLPAPRPPPRREELQVTVIDKPLPPATTEPARPAGTRARPTRPAVPRPTPAASPSPAPPTPPQAAPVPETAQEAPLIAGLALSSTSGGSMAVPSGNARAGQPGTGAPAGAAGAVLVPGHALTEEPVFLDNVSADEVRRYYPEEARKGGIEGLVLVQLTISAEGRVLKVVVSSDPGHGFGPAAARLVRLYRFRPARLDGRPVATEIPMTIRFQLD